jgi:hypothetical protein
VGPSYLLVLFLSIKVGVNLKIEENIGAMPKASELAAYEDEGAPIEGEIFVGVTLADYFALF